MSRVVSTAVVAVLAWGVLDLRRRLSLGVLAAPVWRRSVRVVAALQRAATASEYRDVERHRAHRRAAASSGARGSSALDRGDRAEEPRIPARLRFHAQRIGANPLGVGEHTADAVDASVPSGRHPLDRRDWAGSSHGRHQGVDARTRPHVARGSCRDRGARAEGDLQRQDLLVLGIAVQGCEQPLRAVREPQSFCGMDAARAVSRLRIPWRPNHPGGRASEEQRARVPSCRSVRPRPVAF